MLGTFPVGLFPIAVAFDGQNIWVVNYQEEGASVTKLRASDGKLQGTFNNGILQEPDGVAFDGANIWVTDTDTGTVSKF